MKKALIILFAVLLLADCPYGYAESEMPPEMWKLYVASHETTEFADCIFFDIPDGSDMSAIISPWGAMDIYRCADGEWQSEAQVSPGDGTWQIAFVRHDTLTPRADGSYYPDELGFDLVCEKTGRQISYHYNGTAFVICGWKNPEEYHGEAILNGTTLTFYSANKSTPEFTTTLGTGFDSITTNYDDLPFTPDEAQQRTAITEDMIRNYYPGYALFSHYIGNYQTNAHAEYCKIEDGTLYVIRAEFHSAAKTPYAYECMPIPLSQSFMDRLQTENMAEMLDLRATMDFFLTEGVLDTGRVPVHGKIVNSHLQDRALILLTDEGGKRYLHIIEENDGTYTVQTTRPLPDGTYLDIFHTENGSVQLGWQDDDEKYRTTCFARRADGIWRLSWTMNSGENTEDLTFVYCGIEWEHNIGSSNGVFFGSMPELSLMAADIEQIPRNRVELMPFVDRSDWAVVNNPNPADRLHLRTEPKRDAKSLGKFYNHTPVKVLQTKGDWCKVQIGADGYLTGWMMKKYLAFGGQMDAVDCAFPIKSLVEGLEYCPLYDTIELKKHHPASGEYWIVGVVEDNLYIIVTTNGESGYVPQEWFWDGNG